MKKSETKQKSKIKSGKKKFEPAKLKLLVKRSSAGLGLFAGEEIPKDICIIEYVGRVIKGREEYTSNSKYLFEVHARKTIDGRDRSNTARYINHSCRPNAEIQVRKGRVFIMSIKKIPQEAEITYNYGKEYFDEHIKDMPCRCEKCVEKRSSKTKEVKKK